MKATQDTQIAQGIDIPANGLRRHIKTGDKIIDGHKTLLLHPLQDLLLPLTEVHQMLREKPQR